MPESLRYTRDGGHTLTAEKVDGRYNIAVTGGAQLTDRELGAIAGFIGNDPDGAATLAALGLGPQPDDGSEHVG